MMTPARSGESVRTAAAAWAVSLGALVAAVLLRQLLDPWLGDALPLVTVFGAVAAAAWVGGHRPAAVVAVLGYAACHYLFIPPRHGIDFSASGTVIGLLAYLFTCALIVVFGEAIRRAQARGASQLHAARLLASIIESSDDAIISKGLDGIVQSWNAAAERLFGYAAAEAVGRHISFIIPPDRLSEEDLIISSLKNGRRVDHFETERLRSDGRRILVSLTVSPVHDADGRVIGASKIVRDITERKRAEAEREKLVTDLSDADRRKNEFLAMLAHELRNPLAPISNAARALRIGPTDEKTLRTASAMLERQVTQMSRLVEDLLDMSRISRGRIDLRRERVALAPIVDQAIEASRTLCESMHHELTVSLPTGPVYLDADPARLAQVIGNLLNNACKFTDPGGRLRLTVEVESEEAVIRVGDNGIGIEPAHLSGLFEMFRQVDTSLERSRDGLGIGLTLVKTLVEMHGGSVEAHSDGLGRGSEFVVRLPVLADSQRPAPAPVPEAPASRVPRRVLIVDDSEDGAASLAMLLGLDGHETHLAHDGIAALEAADRLRPDAVLLDIGLPGLNGYEVCARLRQQSWGRDLVVIALTGWGQEEDRQRSRDAGFDAHLVKPVDSARLLKLLAELPEVRNLDSPAH